MQTISLKMPEDLLQKLEHESSVKRISKSDVMRKALDFYFASVKHRPKKASFYELSQDLCGSVDAPEDLSINKDYLEGLGE